MPELTRRHFLQAGAAIAATGAAVGAGFGLRPTPPAPEAVPVPGTGVEPFFGTHQAGIATEPQDRLLFAAFDLRVDTVAELMGLLRDWTEGSARLAQGLPARSDDPSDFAPADSGEALELDPGRLTLTFGFGPGMFTRPGLGLTARRPEQLIDMPPFTRDEIDPLTSFGDIGVQACATDAQVLHHAIRSLSRVAGSRVALRWTQEGFRSGTAVTPGGITHRNLLGFKDGTANPKPGSEVFEANVWVQPNEAPEWMRGGSYLVMRRIRIFVEMWDRVRLSEQEHIIGRTKLAGAPLGSENEFDPLDLARVGPSGQRVMAEGAHIRLSNQQRIRFLRRSYSYTAGSDPGSGELNVGLFFLAYQRDPRFQFVPMQSNLSHSDLMNRFTEHIGTATFAMPPGVQPGEFIGQGLFA